MRLQSVVRRAAEFVRRYSEGVLVVALLVGGGYAVLRNRGDIAMLESHYDNLEVRLLLVHERLAAASAEREALRVILGENASATWVLTDLSSGQAVGIIKREVK